LGAVGETATQVYDRIDCDLLVRSPEYLHVFDPRTLPAHVAVSLASMPEIADIRSLDLGVSQWRNPNSGELRLVAMIGVDPARPALRIQGWSDLASRLRRPADVLIDRASRGDYGPRNHTRFGDADVGLESEVAGKRVVVSGLYDMGTGLAANGAILLSHNGFNRVAPQRMTVPQDERFSMLLIKLRPGVTAAVGVTAIKERLARIDGRSSELRVMTLKEAIANERWHWYTQTPVGFIFGSGVAIAMIIGSVVCYMILSNDVTSRLPEYATLKAIGFSNAYLINVLCAQAVWLALLAFLPSLVVAIVLYAVTSAYAGVDIHMPWFRVVLVFVLSLAMCGVAGVVALRKLTKAEPANLF